MRWSRLIEVVHTSLAPSPVGPYSQAVKAGCFLFVSGQIPIDPLTGELIKDDFSEEVRRVLLNLKAVVEAAGAGLDRIVKVTVYLTDLRLAQEFNRIYAEFFGSFRPSRSLVEVSGLPRGARVEIEAVAYL
ncbi:MAG: RidA family protein, partial [Acidilobaceae archaeon]